jgi:hypothetical protein
VTRPTTRRRLLSGGGAALLTALAGCSGATPFVGKRESYGRTLPTDGVDRLAVETAVGDVRVTAADRDDVAVEVVERAGSLGADLSALAFESERVDGRLDLRSVWRGDDSGFGGRPAMDLDVRVPRSLAVERVRADVGQVTVEGVAGDVDAEAGTGDAVVRGVAGAVTAVSDTGDVTVRSPGALAGAEADTGDVDVEAPVLAGDVRVETDTGDVSLALSPDVDAELAARTDTGDVTVEGLSLSDATRGEALVTGVLGDGTRSLTAVADTGDVTVTALDQ